MADINYKGLFQDWEVAIAKKLVFNFKEEWRCLDIDDFEDILQECLTHWLSVRDKYNPSSEASQQTFMARVLSNKIKDIVKSHNRECRRGSQVVISLDVPLFEEEDSPTLLDNISDGSEGITELKIDLSHVYKQLTPAQRRLCALLGDGGFNINEASEILKKPRGTVYEEINRVKAIFRKERLDEYLK